MIVNLFDICRPTQWKTLSMKDLNDSGFSVYGANGKIGFYPEYNHEHETLLITCRVATCGSMTISWPKSYINGNAMALDDLDTRRVDLRYLFYFLRNRGFVDIISGSAQPQITRQGLQKIQIPLPSLEEQKRIVRELDAADALRQKRKQAIVLLDDYLKAVFLEMFGDPVTNPKGWETQKLGGMIDFMTSGSRGWAKYYADAGDVFLRIQNVQRNYLQVDDLCFVHPPATAEAKRTKVRSGDVLLSITADLGRTAVIPENFGDAYISQHLALLRFKANYLPDYISEFLASQGGALQMAKLNKGGTKAGLNFNDIKSIQIPVPDIKTQQAYIAQKTHIQGIKEFMLTQSEQLDSNFKALMQTSFLEK